MHVHRLVVLATIGLSLACADSPSDISEAPLHPAFITGNFRTDNVHPWVGLIVLYDQDGNFDGRCTGSLISPTKFLTAGHCTTDVGSARIWFAQDAGANFDLTTMMDPVTGYPNSCLPQPAPCVTSHLFYNLGFPGAFPNELDVGVFILDIPVTTLGYGRLAPVGTLDALATRRGLQDVTFVSSGYGVSQVKPSMLSFRERLMTYMQLVNLSSALTDGFTVQISANPGNNRGGVCFGDSGGPLLYEGLIVGISSFGRNGNCVGVDFFYRVDRPEVQNWIANPN
jgi:hypothetical protein